MKTDLEKINKTRFDLVTISKMAYLRGLSSGTSGNISSRVLGNPNQILIKASGKCFGELNPDDFVLIDLDGNILEGNIKPSKEVYFHCGIYKIRHDVNAVFHGHSAYATAYVTQKGNLPLITISSEAVLKKVGIVDSAPAGSRDLANMVIKTFEDLEIKSCVLKRHGFITVAQDIHTAYYLGDVLEDNAKTVCIMNGLK